MSIKLTPNELPREMKRRGKKMPKVIERGLRAGARRGAVILRKRTPVGATTALRRGWQVRRSFDSGEPAGLANLAPHAGIVEKGARPHPVNREGIAAITHWAVRKLGLPRDEAARVAHAVAHKIRREGQKPTYFVRDSLGDLRDAAKKEVGKAISKQARKKA